MVEVFVMDSKIERLKVLLTELRSVYTQRYTNDKNFVPQVAAFWPNFQRKVERLPREKLTLFWEDVATEAAQDVSTLHKLMQEWHARNEVYKEKAEALTREIVRLREELGWSMDQYNAWYEQVFPPHRQPEPWEWSILRVPD